MARRIQKDRRKATAALGVRPGAVDRPTATRTHVGEEAARPAPQLADVLGEVTAARQGLTLFQPGKLDTAIISPDGRAGRHPGLRTRSVHAPERQPDTVLRDLLADLTRSPPGTGQAELQAGQARARVDNNQSPGA